MADNQNPPEEADYVVYSVNMSAMTRSTVSRVRQRNRKLNPAITYALHDNTSPPYGWLLAGWLAEERTMPNGRIYKNYYDPSGHLYRTKNEVILAWEEAGLILLDP